MNLNKILSILLTISLCSCADYQTQKQDQKEYYSSSGFVLIYEEDLFIQKVVNKKINNNEFVILHNSLKKNTPIKIINPKNSKVLETKVHKKGNYPKIFTVVISNKIASFLELDLENPFVEIIEVKKNKTFVAKEGNIYEEERNVADKAPVDQISMSVLSDEQTENTRKNVPQNKYIIVVGDFYYEESALNLRNDLVKKTKIGNISVKKINNKKYRLLVGPFKNFSALKTSYISLNNLGFDALNVKIYTN